MPPASASSKTCPDCAETVLEAARVCRYCGYRFAPPPSPAPARGSSGSGALFDLLRRRKPSSLPDVLAEMGVELAGEEEVRLFALGSVGRARGYVLITDQRLAFLPVPAVQDPIECPAALITELEVSPARRPTVRMRAAGRLLTIQGDRRSFGEEVRAALDAGGRPGGVE